jgi:N-acetyl sugar amidotransferase
MDIIQRERASDPSLYSPNEMNPKTKFGLPQKVVFCKKCVMSNQRPNSEQEYAHTIKTVKKSLNISPDGICDACRFAESKKKTINWEERDRELRDLCDRHRSKDGSYDCIVPGSGGKDSFYAAHVLKYKYGMNPLTCTWAPHMYTDWGWRNLQRWIHAGFDNELFTPNGRVHRLLTRLAVENLFHPFQPFIFGQKFLAPKIALRHKVKLVFFGENEAEYGNPISDNSSAKRDWSYFASSNLSNVYVGGVSVQDLKKQFAITENDLVQYLPCNPEEIEKAGVEVHYTGYYMKWHPQANYYYAVEHGGFEPCPERMPGTYTKYVAIDDKMEDFNYYTTGIKYGLGWTSYIAAHEIRSGDLTREEGIALVKKYDLEFPKRFEQDFLNYISIDPKQFPEAHKMFEQPKVDHDYFMDLHDRFRSPHIWKKENGQWKLRHTVWGEAEEANIDITRAQGVTEWEGNKGKMS